VCAVRLDPVGDADHQQHEAGGEGEIAPPVDLPGLAHAELAQRVVRPDRREEADRNRDDEDEPPFERSEQASEHEPEKRARDHRDAVDAEGEPTLVVREGIGEDRARVREDERATDSLPDPHQDQPERTGAAVQPRDREQDREEGEDREAEIEHPHAAVHVAEPAEADEQHGEHDEEAEEQPEEVARVARLERIDPDPAEDVRQRDQQDRAVDHREQRPERRVRERHPLVVELPRAQPHGVPPRKLDVYVSLADLDELGRRVVDLERRVLEPETVA
jgi:hypothetical protein